MVGDSKAEGEEKWGGADGEESSWYKRHFRESVEKGFESFGWRCSIVVTTKSVREGGVLASLRALHPEREGSKKWERRRG